MLGSREEQQDSFRLYTARKHILASVCDGIGGLNYGKLASETAVGTLLTLYRQNPDIPPDFLFPQIIEHMDAAVCKQVQETHGGAAATAGSTTATVIVHGHDMYWFSVGDSRIYLVHDRHIRQLTQDHNYARYLDTLLAKGEISEAQYQREAMRRHALTSFIGMGNITQYDYSTEPCPLEKGDIVLVTSDGLTNALDDTELLACILPWKSAEKMADALWNAVQQKDRPQQDNTTYILLYRK